jgi:preprotein translocase subunit YajC
VSAVLSILAAEQMSGGLFSILILVLPLGALVYLMIIPQRKQRQKQAQFVSSLGVGDEIVTAGGIYGTITHMEDGVAEIEVDHDVVLRVTVSSISRAASDPEPPVRGAASTPRSKAAKASNGSTAPDADAEAGDDADRTEQQ